MTPELPAKIGRYEIRRELGRGMMGVVYEAYDPALGRRIALKTIQLAFVVSPEERRNFEERFLTEARAAGRLSHPGIVVVHDVGQDETTGTPFIALEHLDGRTLDVILRGEQFIAWQEALRITKGVAEALHHAHSQGVVHRDIKPANIMILDSGEPKIMDFGIAKLESSQLTAAGQFFGTPLYMSPEQALGKPLDARSDLFSLGVLAYGLLTGQQAFGATGVMRIIARVVHDDPPQPTQLVRDLPPEVDYFIARTLAKAPEHRYPDGLTMAEDIDDILAFRAPRHKQEWLALREAQPEDLTPRIDLDSELARLVPEPPRPVAFAAPPNKQPGAAPRRHSLARRLGQALAALTVVSAVGWLLLLRERARLGEHQPPPHSKPRVAQTPEAAPTVATPEPTPAPTPKTQVQALPAGTPSDLARRKPTPKTTSARREPARPAPSPDEPPAARLAIDLENSLKSGTLRVWVDNALVVEQSLERLGKKSALSFRKGAGKGGRTLELKPGYHEVVLQIAWEDNVKTKMISGHFASGAGRRLSAKFSGGMLGLVKKDLELEWE